MKHNKSIKGLAISEISCYKEKKESRLSPERQALIESMDKHTSLTEGISLSITVLDGHTLPTGATAAAVIEKADHLLALFNEYCKERESKGLKPESTLKEFIGALLEHLDDFTFYMQNKAELQNTDNFFAVTPTSIWCSSGHPRNAQAIADYLNWERKKLISSGIDEMEARVIVLAGYANNPTTLEMPWCEMPVSSK